MNTLNTNTVTYKVDITDPRQKNTVTFSFQDQKSRYSDKRSGATEEMERDCREMIHDDMRRSKASEQEFTLSVIYIVQLSTSLHYHRMYTNVREKMTSCCSLTG